MLPYYWLNQVWAITFDWSALATWNKYFWTAFWKPFSGKKTRIWHRHVCAIVQPWCAICLSMGMQVLFFAFCCENWHRKLWIDKKHPRSLRRGQTCFLMFFTQFWGKFRIMSLCLCYFLSFFQLWSYHLAQSTWKLWCQVPAPVTWLGAGCAGDTSLSKKENH